MRGLDKDGKEISQRTASFQNTQIVDRSTVAPDLLSISTVQAMQASIEQQVARARQTSIPLYWLGMELPRPFTDAKGNRQSGLVLNDVLVLDQPNQPRRVVLSYGTRDEPAGPLRADPAPAALGLADEFLSQAQGRLWFQADGVQRRSAALPGGQATQFELQPSRRRPPPRAAQAEGGRARPRRCSSRPC